MKATTIFTAAIIATAALATSCTSRVYERAAAYTLAGDDTYGFATARVNQAYDKISAPATMTVTLTRKKSAEMAVVPLQISNIPGLPQSVTFEAGSKTATVELDLAAVKAGTTLNDTIRFAKGVNTSGELALNIEMRYTWVAMASADRAYSLLTDDVVATAKRGRAATFPVVIEEALEQPGMYRLVNPMKGFELSDNEADHYLVIDATNPNRVSIAKQNVGGDICIESASAYFLAQGRDELLIEDAKYFGKVVNGEIIFPRAMSFNLWNGQSAQTANITGDFRVVLPEKVAEVERTISHADYALGVEYIARSAELNGDGILAGVISTDAYAINK